MIVVRTGSVVVLFGVLTAVVCAVFVSRLGGDLPSAGAGWANASESSSSREPVDAFELVSGADRSATVAARVLPRPQYVVNKQFMLQLDQSWTIALDTADPAYSFAGTWFNNEVVVSKTMELGVVDGSIVYPQPKRIVVGDPAKHEHVSDALARRGRRLPAEIGDEGYLLEVFGDPTPEIVIAANTPNGAFYGVVTLLQLLESDARLPGVFIVDFPDHDTRGSYNPDNARMEWRDDAYHFTESNKQFIDWLAAHKMNTFFAVENGAFFRDEAAWRVAYDELFAYARQRFVEPVPRICSISTVSPFSFENFEGWYVENEPFTFDGGDVARTQAGFDDLAVNGGFELDEDGDGTPDGWSARSRPGATWSIDDSKATEGENSMRLDIPQPATDSSQAILSTTVSGIDPDATYCVWSKAWAEDIETVRPQLTVYARNVDRQVVVLQSDVTWSTNRWRDFGACVRVPSDATDLTVYARIQSPGSGTFWLDDVRIHRVDGALRNVIRASDTDFRVTDLERSVTYELGRDYEVENGDTGMKFVPTMAPFVIRRLPAGRIDAGQTVLVSYDAYFFVQLSGYWKSAPNVSRDELYTDYYEPAIDKVVQYYRPKMLNIDADEIRGFYRDSRMQRRFASNAEAIAYWANRVRSYAVSRDPDVKIWIWDDMVSPYHNGGVEDYQQRYGGLPGRMAEATEKGWIDKSVVMDVWWYGDNRISQMWHSIVYFGRQGYPVMGSPWQSEENIVSWSEMLVDQPHSLGGVETNWGTPFEQPHEWFADNFWNTRYSLLLFDSFEDDADNDGLPDGWRIDGEIDYSTDGSMSHGDRYADFPNRAVGITTKTVRVILAQPLDIEPGAEYVFSTFAKRAGDGTRTSNLTLAWVDADNTMSSMAKLVMLGLTQEYKEYELRSSAPDWASEVHLALGGNVEDVWYDVVRFRKAREFSGDAGAGMSSVWLPVAARGN